MASFLALYSRLLFARWRWKLPCLYICNNRYCVIEIIPGFVFNIKINCFSYFLFQEIGEQQVFDLSDIPTCLSSAKKTCGTFSKITQLPELDQRLLPSNAWKNTRKHPQKKVKGQLHVLCVDSILEQIQIVAKFARIFGIYYSTSNAFPLHAIFLYSTASFIFYVGSAVYTFITLTFRHQVSVNRPLFDKPNYQPVEGLPKWERPPSGLERFYTSQ